MQSSLFCQIKTTHNPFKQVNTPKVSEPVREETYISSKEVDPFRGLRNDLVHNSYYSLLP